jgi:cell division protein ZapA (FtsZ GTPase activity inhibitor)
MIGATVSLRHELSELRLRCRTMEEEREKWLAMLDEENTQLKQLMEDAKLSKEQLIKVLAARRCGVVALAVLIVVTLLLRCYPRV